MLCSLIICFPQRAQNLWSEICPAGHTVKAMEGHSKLKTGLGGQRKEDVLVPELSWDWQESVPPQHSCPGISQSRGHLGNTSVIISTLNPQERQRKVRRSTQEEGEESSPSLAAPYQG